MFVRLPLKVVTQNDRDFVDVILLQFRNKSLRKAACFHSNV